LATQLARWGRFSRERARFYAAEIVEGVEGLHKNGIVYQDLQLGTCSLALMDIIVLTDFGLSKSFPSSINGVALSPNPEQDPPNGISNTGAETTSTFCGAAEYLAPEVIQGLPCSSKSTGGVLGHVV